MSGAPATAEMTAIPSAPPASPLPRRPPRSPRWPRWAELVAARIRASPSRPMAGAASRLGGRGEHRPHPQVVGPFRLRLPRLLQAGGADPDQRPRAQYGAGGAAGQVLLPQVDAVRPRGRRHVHPVVDDERVPGARSAIISLMRRASSSSSRAGISLSRSCMACAPPARAAAATSRWPRPAAPSLQVTTYSRNPSLLPFLTTKMPHSRTGMRQLVYLPFVFPTPVLPGSGSRV